MKNAVLLVFTLPLASFANGDSAVNSGIFISPSSSTLAKRQLSSSPCLGALEPANGAPVVGSGWVAQLASSGLSGPRSLVSDPSGALLVLERGVGITRIVYSDPSFSNTTTACMQEKNRTTIVRDAELNHGLALSPTGNILYASTRDKLYAWDYNANTGSVASNEGEIGDEGRRTVIKGMDNDGHTTRTVLVLQDGRLVVSRGSDGNIDPQTREEQSGVSQIRMLSSLLSGDVASAQEYTSGVTIGWGLRNSVGLTQDPLTGALWSVENSADNIFRSGEDVHADNPAEELNYHGVFSLDSDNDDFESNEHVGRNYGYPDCFTVWDAEDLKEQNLKTGDVFSIDSSQMSDEECTADTESPRLSFQAHVAPLDVMITSPSSNSSFSEEAGGENNDRKMLITFHGSWNRPSPVGYALVSVALDQDTGMPIAAADVADATTLVLSNPDLDACPEGCFRPVGLAQDSEGRVYMSSDSTGEIFVLHRADFSATGTDGAEAGVGSSGDEAEDEDEEDGALRVTTPGIAFAGVIGVLVAMLL